MSDENEPSNDNTKPNGIIGTVFAVVVLIVMFSLIIAARAIIPLHPFIPVVVIVSVIFLYWKHHAKRN